MRHWIRVRRIFQANASRVRIIEYPNSEILNPNIVIGLPEAGLVGSIASSYLAQSLKLPEIGYIESELEPPVVLVEGSIPRYPIRIFGREDLIVVVCDIPLTPRLATEFSNSVIDWAVTKNTKLVLGATGLPSNTRLEQKEEIPAVFYASTAGKDAIARISTNARVLEEGIVVGTYALILRNCMRRNQANITFFAESHLDFPDPGAAAAVVNILNKFLGTQVDIKPLLDESDQVRLRTRELMKRTQQSMQQMSREATGLYA
jgi:uncharacterized protein